MHAAQPVPLVFGFTSSTTETTFSAVVNRKTSKGRSWTNHAPTRARKLLLNRQEISKIENKLKESGLTLIPLSLYFNDGKAKVEIAVARGRKNYDKRQAIAEKDAKRETQRATGRRDKGME